MKKLLLLSFLLTSCGDTYNIIAPSSVFSGGPGTPVASPSPGQTCASITRMPVGFFGFRGCPSDPRNREGRLPILCVADATATPFLSTGDKATKEVHGSNIQWEVLPSTGTVILSQDTENPFNAVVVPRALGFVTIRARLLPPGCQVPVIGEFTFEVVAGS